MIGRTFSTPSPGSSTSVSPGRSSPIAAITVWCVPWITWGVSPSAVMCCDHVLDLLGRRVRFHDHDHGSPPSLGRTLAGRDSRPTDRSASRDRLDDLGKRKKPRDLKQVPGPWVYAWKVEWRLSETLRPRPGDLL